MDCSDKGFDEGIPALFAGHLAAAGAAAVISAVSSAHVDAFDFRRELPEPCGSSLFIGFNSARGEAAGKGFALQYLCEESSIFLPCKELFFPVRITVKGTGTEGHESDFNTGVAALFKNQIFVTLPAVVVVDDDTVEVQFLHTAQKSSQLLRSMSEQTFTWIESPDGKKFFHFLSC